MIYSGSQSIELKGQSLWGKKFTITTDVEINLLQDESTRIPGAA